MLRHVSLRLQLLVSLSGLFLAAWTILVLLDLYNGRQIVAELMDDHLAQTGNLLMGITLHELAETDPAYSLQLEEVLPAAIYHGNLAFRIWLQGNLLLASDHAPPFQYAAPTGYADTNFKEGWRVLTLHHEEQAITVSVGMPYLVIFEKMGQIALQLLLPLVITLPLMGLSIWFGVRHGLQPLRRVAAEIAKRSPTLLDPVNATATPEEILPLIRSLNHLLVRLRHTLEAERRFTAHAAHELRTPLASLKVQAQVALRSTEEQTRTLALQKMVASADRSTHLVQQLLTLARLDTRSASQHRQLFSPGFVVQELLAEIAPEAMEKSLELELSNLLPAARDQLLGMPGAFAILARNLVDNAIRYTPAHGKVTVVLQACEEGIHLLVDDNGPGIAADQRSEMFETFRRGAVQDTLGCGLGLSIVAAIVSLHQGTIALQDSPLGGLRAKVYLPKGQGEI